METTATPRPRRGHSAETGARLRYPHYDEDPSFDDFESFGGWTTPSMKQYSGDQDACGMGVDYNYLP